MACGRRTRRRRCRPSLYRRWIPKAPRTRAPCPPDRAHASCIYGETVALRLPLNVAGARQGLGSLTVNEFATSSRRISGRGTRDDLRQAKSSLKGRASRRLRPGGTRPLCPTDAASMSARVSSRWVLHPRPYRSNAEPSGASVKDRPITSWPAKLACIDVVSVGRRRNSQVKKRASAPRRASAEREPGVEPVMSLSRRADV